MVNQNKKYKIALVGDCLSGGGAEKVLALMSIYFQKQDIEVNNCIFVDWISYEYAGELLNLGKIKTNSNFVIRKFSRFLVFQKFINQNNFDFVIDFRMRTNSFQEWLFSKFIYDQNVFYTVHSGILEFYFSKSSFVSRLIYKNKNIIGVSKAIKNEIIAKNLADKVDCIYNPIDLDSIEQMKNQYVVDNGNYILAIGRMNDEVKQFDRLITAYSKSNLPKNNITLILLGEGENKVKYQQLAVQLGLGDLILFKNFVENPFPYYKNALFTVLSSKNEGFPNALVESLATETPVIAFDCFSGPNEIIINRHNGILVDNQNFKRLTEAMNEFVENNELYIHCKNNSKESVLQFDLERIGQQWLDLLKNAVS